MSEEVPPYYDEEKQPDEEEEREEMYEHHRIVADGDQSLLRIDKYLFNRLSKSRNKIQQAAKANCLLVNGKAVKASYKVRPQDEIVIVLPKPPGNYELIPEEMDLAIVYEDETLMVINKPAGLVVHPGVGNYSGTLVHGLLYHLQQKLPVNKSGSGISLEAEMRPGLVHRIDKNTSGLLVIAKDEDALTHLAKQFFDHTVIRRYIALVWGDLENDEGTITGHIGRNPKNRKIMYVFPEGEQGKHAVTHYKVLRRYGYVTLVECRLETGRTHQIRVHFQYIKHPLFNDWEYGGDRILKGTVYSKYKQFITNCFLALPRQALHAKILGFIHPKTGKKMYFEQELPEDIQTVLEKWDRYMANLK